MLRNNVISRIFAGFSIGVVIGGVLALLFAPQSGEEARSQIVYLSKKAKNNTKRSFKRINASVVSYIKNKFDGKRAIV